MDRWLLGVGVDAVKQELLGVAMSGRNFVSRSEWGDFFWRKQG